MTSPSPHRPIALLFSGGLDSAILLGHLLDQGHAIQPLYIRTDVAWLGEELTAVHRYLAALRRPKLDSLVSLEMPLADLYGEHWCIHGQNVPNDQTPDEAVYLPGRNPLLLIKATIWCQLHKIDKLALATLASNPFPDATDEFFASFARSLTLAGQRAIEIVQPFASLSKHNVMELGRRWPLQHTFSCISPIGGRHCGRCNKCGERKGAFRDAAMRDPTEYADRPHPAPHERVYL